MEKNKYMMPEMKIVEITGKEMLLDASLGEDGTKTTSIDVAGKGDLSGAYAREYDPWGLDDED